MTTMNPRISQRRNTELPGASGSIPMPRKTLGSAMSMIEMSIVDISIPSVVLLSAIHL